MTGTVIGTFALVNVFLFYMKNKIRKGNLGLCVCVFIYLFSSQSVPPRQLYLFKKLINFF